MRQEDSGVCQAALLLKNTHCTLLQDSKVFINTCSPTPDTSVFFFPSHKMLAVRLQVCKNLPCQNLMEITCLCFPPLLALAALELGAWNGKKNKI